ncbi:MAG TPA: hypothetical protein VFE42_23575 [Chloroflexota bacterium]|nr:hypothetical protein [Chloroflexota bacterium]
MDPRFILVELPLAQSVITARAAESRPAAPDQDPVAAPVPVPALRPHAWPVRAGTRRGPALWVLRFRAALSRWA